MEIKVTERTIVEADVHLDAATIQLCFEQPYEFAELIAEQMRPLLSAGKPTLPARRKPKTASHITIGNGKTVRRSRQPKSSTAPKAPAGAKLPKTACPECGKSIATKFLPRHLETKHSPASTQPATADAAA